MQTPDTPIFRSAKIVASKLREAGHEVYFAGGCVRDLVLGVVPQDVDIATSAHPEQVEALFRRTMSVGKQFGVIVVLEGKASFEVATFRNDGAYVDGRRPDSVTFSTAREDVERRDFTINGLLMDPETEEVVDFVGGLADLESRVIRAIGDPAARFREDRLRLLRAVRFAARLGFEIETETAAAMKSLAAHAADPSAERVFGELERMVREHDPVGAIRLLDRHDMLEVVLPEVANKKKLQLDERLVSPDSRGSDAWSRFECICFDWNATPPRGSEFDPAIFWAPLLQDLGAGHPAERVKAAAAVLTRLRVSKQFLQDVTHLIRWRDRLVFCREPGRARQLTLRADPLLRSMEAYAGFEWRASHPSMRAPRPAR